MEIKEGPQATRIRIAEAALRLFSQKGYLGATTKAIAKEAGIAEVTLFRHFTSKEELFEEAINIDSFLPTLIGLLPEIEEKPYEEALFTIALGFLDALDLKKGLIRIMLSEVHRYPEKIRMIHRSFIEGLFQTLASYFLRLQEKKVLGEFDAGTAARAFLGMIFSLFIRTEIILGEGGEREEREKNIREYVRLFVHGTLNDRSL